MAVPWHEERNRAARALAVEVGGASIVWDQKHDAFDTWQRTLQYAGLSPVVILEDDVVLTADWRAKVEAAVAEHPRHVIQFFSNRKADVEVGSRWARGRTFMMNQCYYLPSGYAASLLRYSDGWHAANWEDNPTGYDLCMAEWLKEHSLSYWMHVPSLVQHQKWRSAINPSRPSNRQSRTFE